MRSNSITLQAITVPVVLATSLAGTAYAQSSVTLFGTVDMALAHGSGSISNLNQMASGYLAASRIGFRGQDDLGGSLKAGFWLESGVNADTGTGQATNINNQSTGITGNGGLTFNRRSTISVGNSWGEIRLGREYVPQYMNLAVFDPFDLGGSGGSQVLNSAITGPTTVRASNSISYLYGHSFNASSIGYGPQGFSGSGFQFNAMYYMGENPSGTPTSKDGNGFGVRAGYSTGTFTVAGAVSRARYAAGDVRQNNAGASYDFGVAYAMGMYEWDKNGPISARGWLVGAKIPAGAGAIRIAYSRYSTDAASSPTAKKWALGYVYTMSKRTALYTAIAHVSNGGTSASALDGAVTAPGKSSNGFDIGIRHNF